MDRTDSEVAHGALTRRQTLRRGALAGGALAWTVPAIQSLAGPAVAATASPTPEDTPTPSTSTPPTGSTPTPTPTSQTPTATPTPSTSVSGTKTGTTSGTVTPSTDVSGTKTPRPTPPDDDLPPTGTWAADVTAVGLAAIATGAAVRGIARHRAQAAGEGAPAPDENEH